MIKVHRRKRVAHVQGVGTVALTSGEYLLMTAFGMMGDKLVSYELLADVALEYPCRTPGDLDIIWQRIYRLKRKLGLDFVKCNKQQGYRLIVPVEFTG
jgi:hypothetical protein